MTYKERLHDVIPGGAHTYSRGDGQFPSNAPSILERGEGAFVYCPDGQRFLDYGMGLRSVNIGYGNKEIADACYDEIIKGNNLTRASITELKAAELMSELIPSIEMVKFARTGGEINAVAIRIARAYSGKSKVVVCGYHGWHDWYLSTNIIQDS